MVSIAASKMGMTELIFVHPGMKVNGQYYRDVSYSLSRCCQRSTMLQAIRLSFNKPTLHLIVPRTQTATASNAGLYLWPPNSPDL